MAITALMWRTVDLSQSDLTNQLEYSIIAFVIVKVKAECVVRNNKGNESMPIHQAVPAHFLHDQHQSVRDLIWS